MKLCKSKKRGSKALALICALMLVLAQLVLVMPAIQEAFAQPGGDLEIRVKYFGDQENKIRTKCTFTPSDLQSMNAQEWCYSNVTSVGTVMVMKARGPQVIDVIEAAGIDLNSVQRINFRAGDNYGYTKDFTVGQISSGGRWYYPNLSSNYVRGEDQKTLTPKEGALANGHEVPAILALEFGATKEPGRYAEELELETKDVYRFCLGQTPLQEGVSTGGDKDVTSSESIRMIHGIDVTLYGSPVEDIMMDISDGQMKVGSKKKLGVSFSGDELFANDLAAFAGKLKWKSSDPSVVKVDQKGNITVLKKGRATITVTAANGMSASVTIEGVEDPKEGKAQAAQKNNGAKSDKSKAETSKNNGQTGSSNRNPSTKKGTGKSVTATSTQVKAQKKMIVVREIEIGEMITPEMSVQDQMRQAMAEDAQALGKIREYGKGVAAGTGAGALIVGGAGAVLRIRRFRRDIM